MTDVLAASHPVSLKMLIDGERVAAGDGAEFPSFDPATGQTWATVPEATAADVDGAVEAAHRAMYEGPWSSMTPTERGRLVGRLGDAVAEASEHLGRVETKDTGKLFNETRWQARYIAEYFTFFGGAADKIHGETLPIDKTDLMAFTLREPVGVVAAVVPWNSQMFLSATKIGPALAAGNAVVLKASEHASAPLLELADLVAEAGIPDGVVNIVTGHGDVCGKALTSHPLVAKIAFTGGPVAAQHIIRNSAENYAQVSLELGGKSPFVVFDDANLEAAVNASVAGIFAASGQSCVAGSRLYLQDGIADAFLERMQEVVATITVGNPTDETTDMGPLCTQGQMNHIEAQVALASAEGGTVLAGGKRIDGNQLGEELANGLFYPPTIIDCPKQDMTIVDTELFGPVLSVQRFSTEAEAVRLANNSKHGLAAGIFTSDSARSLRMSKAMRAGIVWVNTYRVISPIATFGGVRMSGYGREAGLQSLYDYTRPKTVWLNLSDEPISGADGAGPFVPR